MPRQPAPYGQHLAPDDLIPSETRQRVAPAGDGSSMLDWVIRGAGGRRRAENVLCASMQAAAHTVAIAVYFSGWKIWHKKIIYIYYTLNNTARRE